MSSAKIDKIEIIGKSFLELLQYEQDVDPRRRASYDLISTVLNAPRDCSWRRFLLEGDQFVAVVRQSVAIAERDSSTPKAATDAIRVIVETACSRSPQTAFSFLKAYLNERPHFPSGVRNRLDQLARAGKRTIPLRAATLASELERLQLHNTLNSADWEVVDQWYDKIMRGEITASQAQNIPAQIREARDRLPGHPAMADVLNAMQSFQLTLDVEQIELFLKDRSKEEVVRRLARLGEWMQKVNVWMNHDGVILTPKLIKFLSQKGDFESLLGELDRHREETRNGRFRIDNEIQRELEFKRFVSAARNTFVHPSTWPRWSLLDPMPETGDLPQLFSKLKELPPPSEQAYVPTRQDRLEAKRAAYEAVLFLQMLKGFRARTRRHIMVVGNERYGRQWVIEPIEEHLLDEGFTIVHGYVYSGASMRLTVPSPFPREVVKGISARMPHLVIVDGAGWPRSNPYSSNPTIIRNVMRCSRAVRGYANWIVAFNDVRADGNVSKYANESSLPETHIPELKKWYEFAKVREEIADWVTPGETYAVTTWGPELMETVWLGDVEVARQQVELSGEKPIAVLANANFYRDQGNDIPDFMKETRPYYFDEPNTHVNEMIDLGFGSHGFETRVNGTTTASFVAVMQRHIKAEIARLLKNWTELKILH